MFIILIFSLRYVHSYITILYLCTIRRNHIVEDAFHCLQRMSAAEMKHAFRVKFLNKEGLEEAGVDQAGIFKGLFLYSLLINPLIM